MMLCQQQQVVAIYTPWPLYRCRLCDGLR
jgi:hypothetical protein